MKVETGSVVTISYDILDEEGEIIESSDLSGPVSFLVGKGAIIKGLDEQVTGMAKGEEKSFELPPEQAFGRPEDGPTRALSRKDFPEGAQFDPGQRFEAGMGSGGQKVLLEVVETDDETVTVRMIHPLAGQTISMTIKVLNLRNATAAEKDAGRAISAPPPPPPPKKS
ncbi:MAG: peptidylprolyl isomerase [Myxococcales bacterium]|nr:peptidylprolyl isomerase [Myxococcales bacterium]